MKTVTLTELKNNINSLLEEVLRTGIPIEINKEGKLLLISPVEKTDKLQNLVHRPHVIQGNPDDLVNIKWEEDVNLNLQETPYLKSYLKNAIEKAYPNARKLAIKEGKLAKYGVRFPNESEYSVICPFSIEGILDEEFYGNSKNLTI